MDFSDEQVRDMLELKERTMQRIEKYQNEIRLLEKQLDILDSIVKQSSFTKASSLPKSGPPRQQQQQQQPQRQRQGEPARAAGGAGGGGGRRVGGGDSPIQITRNDGGGGVIASAYVTPDEVSVVLEGSVEIDADTPPFKTFFLDRIIGDMKRRDAADDGIPDGSAIDCTVGRDGPRITEIVVRNYRLRGRADEIVRAAGWSLNKMLENASG